MSQDRCHARNQMNQRCTVVGEHTEITNSQGQRALAHETKTSLWSTPISSITVVGGTKPRPEALQTMMRRANTDQEDHRG